MATTEIPVNSDEFEMMDKLGSGIKQDRIEALHEIAAMDQNYASYMGCADAVASMLNDPEEEVVMAACEALGALGEYGASYKEELLGLFSSKNTKVKCIAIGSLGMMGTSVSHHSQTVEKLLADTDHRVRAAACMALGNMKITSKANDIKKLLSDKHADVVSGAITALTMLEDEGKAFADEIAKTLAHANKDVKMSSILYFTKHDDLALEHASSICETLQDANYDVRQSVVAFFTQMGSKAEPMIPDVTKCLKHKLVHVKAASALALGAIGSPANSQADDIAKLLDDLSEDRDALVLSTAGIGVKPSAELRMPAAAAAMALSQTKSKVEAMLGSRNPRVKAGAIEALMSMGEESADLTDQFKSMFEDRSIVVRCAAIRAMGGVGPRGQCYAPDVCREIYCGLPAVQLAVMETLAEMGERGSAFADEVAEFIQDQNASVRIGAVESLAKMGDAASTFMSSIEDLKNDPVPAVRDAAMKAALQTAAIGE